MKLTALALLAAAACGGSSSPATTTTTPPPPPPAAPTAFKDVVSGHGRVVIFIPGLASPGSVWDGTVAHLAGAYETHVLTLAGFAGEPAIAPPFLATVHDQLAAYLKRFDHPIVVGHSLGGMMSLWLAETSSADLGGIIDVEGLPFLSAAGDPTMTEARAAEFATKLRDQTLALTPDALRESMKQYFAGAITKPADQARLLDASAKSDLHAYANAFTDLLTKDLRPGLGTIATKVTVIAATNSQDAKRPQLEAVWHSQIDPIKGAELHFVDAAKHFVMLDQPDAFYALIDQALEQALVQAVTKK